MADLLTRAVNRPLSIRIVSAVTTELCREAALRHEATPAAACALARGLTAGILLGTLSNTGERVTLQIVGDGPLKGLTVDAYDDGDVRGYPQVPGAGAGMDVSRRQRLSPLVGTGGLVNVMRDIGERDHYQGQVPLRRGEIDEDVEAYLRQSEQIPSALGCEVVIGPGGQVAAAAGLLVQVMPGGNTETIWQVQDLLRSGALYDLLAQGGGGLTPTLVAQAMMPGLEVEPLDDRALRFRCRCSQGRIEGMLRTLPPQDLAEMAAEGQAEITCNYCNHHYVVDAATLLRIRQEVTPQKEAQN